MSLIWAIVTGFILSFIFKSGWFFILGLFIGPMLYRAFNRVAPIHQGTPNPTLFLTVAFEVLGHLSKAKGKVTQDDIYLASRFMDELQLDFDKRKLAQSSFNLGKSADYPLRQRVRELYAQYRYRKKALNIFCQQLIQAAIHDGVLLEKERDVLLTVAQELHIPEMQMNLYIQMMMASYQFQHGQYSQQGYGQRRQSYDEGNPYQKRTSSSDIENAYHVLGVDSSADVTAIKRAYRKLMNEYHPDKLASKGLPKEMLESAKKRAQEIQAAYDLIKSHKGFK